MDSEKTMMKCILNCLQESSKVVQMFVNFGKCHIIHPVTLLCSSLSHLAPLCMKRNEADSFIFGKVFYSC